MKSWVRLRINLLLNNFPLSKLIILILICILISFTYWFLKLWHNLNLNVISSTLQEWLETTLSSTEFSEREGSTKPALIYIEVYTHSMYDTQVASCIGNWLLFIAPRVISGWFHLFIYISITHWTHVSLLTQDCFSYLLYTSLCGFGNLPVSCSGHNTVYINQLIQ